MRPSLLLGLLCMLAVSCLGEHVATQELQGRAPIDRFTVVDSQSDGRMIGIYLQSGTDWRALVNLESFAEFRPAMSIAEAVRRAGSPDEIEGSKYIYHRPQGRVTVAHVIERSGGAAFEQWQTSVNPVEKQLTDVFSSNISLQIRPLLRERSQLVLLHPSGYAPVLSANVNEEGKVDSMTWYRE
jgi:hypothetical protein